MKRNVAVLSIAVLCLLLLTGSKSPKIHKERETKKIVRLLLPCKYPGVIRDETMPFFNPEKTTRANRFTVHLFPVSFSYWVEEGMITREEADYFLSQIETSSNDPISLRELISCVKMVDSKELADMWNTSESSYDLHDSLFEKFGTKTLYGMSSILFNQDYTKAIVQLDDSQGPLMGGGALYLLKKRWGRWVKVDGRLAWIS